MSEPCAYCGRYLRAYGGPYPDGVTIYRDHDTSIPHPKPGRKRDTRPVRIITPALVERIPALKKAGYEPRWVPSTKRWADQRVAPELAAIIDETRHPEGMLGMAEAAEMLGISRQAVKGLADRGQLELRISVVDERPSGERRQRSNGGGVRTTFVTRESVKAYMERKTKPTAQP